MKIGLFIVSFGYRTQKKLFGSANPRRLNKKQIGFTINQDIKTEVKTTSFF